MGHGQPAGKGPSFPELAQGFRGVSLLGGVAMVAFICQSPRVDASPCILPSSLNSPGSHHTFQ